MELNEHSYQLDSCHRNGELNSKSLSFATYSYLSLYAGGMQEFHFTRTNKNKALGSFKPFGSFDTESINKT